ncbi:MAG: hypothetical protein ACRD35_07800 [Candidatus Acidiferrales bacterium]
MNMSKSFRFSEAMSEGIVVSDALKIKERKARKLERAMGFVGAQRRP